MHLCSRGLPKNKSKTVRLVGLFHMFLPVSAQFPHDRLLFKSNPKTVMWEPVALRFARLVVLFHV